mmetsp:Transcript_26761/g.50520  ORF Transcript_26761/g.50520 Transcript_26761/m.50520 type:complete len:98 (-) Transcript_26761:7-300(-)
MMVGSPRERERELATSTIPYHSNNEKDSADDLFNHHHVDTNMMMVVLVERGSCGDILRVQWMDSLPFCSAGMRNLCYSTVHWGCLVSEFIASPTKKK